MKGLFFFIIFFVIVLPIYFSVHGLHINTGNGEHTGYVTDVEKNGVIYKTGRAYIKTDVSSSQEDQYCVIDPNVYQQLQEKSMNKEKVTVQYFSWMFTGIKNCDGEPAIISGIK